MRKGIVMAGVIGLTVLTICGCGVPEAEEIAGRMYDTSIESAKIKTSFDFELSGESDKDDITIAVNGDFDLQGDSLNTKKPTMYADGSVDVDITDFFEENVDVNAYYLGDDETVYLKKDKEWYEIDVDDTDFSPNAKALGDCRKTFSGIWKDAEVAKQTVEINNEDCYVLTTDVNGEDVIKLIGCLADSVGLADDWDDIVDDFGDKCDAEFSELIDGISISATGYVSKDSGYMIKCDITTETTDIISVLDDLDVDIDDIFEDLDKLKLKKCEFHYMLSDINETDVEIDDDIIDDALDFDDINNDDIDDDDIDDDDDDNDDDDNDDDDDDDDDDSGVFSPEDIVYYDESAGTIDVADSWDSGRIVAHLYVPEGFDVTYCSSYGWSFDMCDADGNEINISSDTDYYIMDLLDYRIWPDEYDFPNFDATIYPFSEYDVNGETAYVLYYQYDIDSEPTYYTLVLVPYIDQYGDSEYISIELPSFVTDDPEGDELLFGYLDQILADYLL